MEIYILELELEGGGRKGVPVARGHGARGRTHAGRIYFSVGRFTAAVWCVPALRTAGGGAVARLSTCRHSQMKTTFRLSVAVPPSAAVWSIPH